MAERRFGIQVVREALRAGAGVERIWLERGWTSNPRLAELASLARRRGVRVAEASRPDLDQLAGGGRHQGAVAEVEPQRHSAVPELLELASKRDEDLFLLALDGIQDPQNLGAILRTADAVGVHGVLVPKHGAAGITSAVARASAGAAAYVLVAPVTNVARELEGLKERGVWVYGLDTSGEADYDTADYRRPVVLVLGGEGRGLRRLVREACDVLLRIPMRGHVESLNASVAAALVMYQAWRTREQQADTGSHRSRA